MVVSYTLRADEDARQLCIVDMLSLLALSRWPGHRNVDQHTAEILVDHVVKASYH